MSLDKSIQYGKEHRKKYYGSKAIDKTCRCGGSCEYCQGNRHYNSLKNLEKMLDRQKEWSYN